MSEQEAAQLRDYILQLESEVAQLSTESIDLKERYDEVVEDAIQLHTQVIELQAENAELRDQIDSINQPSYD